MDLRVDQGSHLPVHVQLEEQIKHLILTGKVEAGERLPSIRALAGFLRVNRNTVARVVSDLEREGYVESRRGSGVYVARPPVGGLERRREEVVERVLDLAAARDVPVEEVAYALLARSGLFRSEEKSKVLFVECTRAELEQFAGELEDQLPVEVERVMLEDLAERVATEPEPPWRLAATTFFHVHEVQEVLEPLGVETVALLAEANLQSLQKLLELEEGTPVGIVGASETCLVNLSRSLEGAGLGHLDLREVYTDEPEEVENLFREVRAIVCSSITAGRLVKLGVPEEIELIEEDRTLDKGGVEMLGQRLREAREKEPR